MRLRNKLCNQCNIDFDILYRASIDSKNSWDFYCGKCLVKIKSDNLNYHYGGTWKKKKE